MSRGKQILSTSTCAKFTNLLNITPCVMGFLRQNCSDEFYVWKRLKTSCIIFLSQKDETLGSFKPQLIKNISLYYILMMIIVIMVMKKMMCFCDRHCCRHMMLLLMKCTVTRHWGSPRLQLHLTWMEILPRVSVVTWTLRMSLGFGWCNSRRTQMNLWYSHTHFKIYIYRSSKFMSCNDQNDIKHIKI